MYISSNMALYTHVVVGYHIASCMIQDALVIDIIFIIYAASATT